MRLKGRVAIVTGASRGIGNAVVRAFAREGARVVLNYIEHEDEALRTVDQINTAGGTAFAFKADVTRSDQINAMVAATVERLGTVDVLVNNAGIYPRSAWIDITEDEWDRVLAVNLKSCFLCSKAVYPAMKAQGYGRIINVSSVTFWNGQANLAHYVASKGGIIGFTRAIAREVGGDGITVNAITPGAVQTETELEMFPDQQDEFAARFAELQSIPRRQIPADVTGAFVFLASEEAAFITGQTLNADGGWMMH